MPDNYYIWIFLDCLVCLIFLNLHCCSDYILIEHNHNLPGQSIIFVTEYIISIWKAQFIVCWHGFKMFAPHYSAWSTFCSFSFLLNNIIARNGIQYGKIVSILLQHIERQCTREHWRLSNLNVNRDPSPQHITFLECHWISNWEYGIRFLLHHFKSRNNFSVLPLQSDEIPIKRLLRPRLVFIFASKWIIGNFESCQLSGWNEYVENEFDVESKEWGWIFIQKSRDAVSVGYMYHWYIMKCKLFYWIWLGRLSKLNYVTTHTRSEGNVVPIPGRM